MWQPVQPDLVSILVVPLRLHLQGLHAGEALLSGNILGKVLPKNALGKLAGLPLVPQAVLLRLEDRVLPCSATHFVPYQDSTSLSSVLFQGWHATWHEHDVPCYHLLQTGQHQQSLLKTVTSTSNIMCQSLRKNPLACQCKDAVEHVTRAGHSTVTTDKQTATPRRGQLLEDMRVPDSLLRSTCSVLSMVACPNPRSTADLFSIMASSMSYPALRQATHCTPAAPTLYRQVTLA